MWQHPITRRHLRQIALAAGLTGVPDYLDEMAVTAATNERCPLLRIVPPQVKTLACGDEGIGAMAEVAEIVAVVHDRLETQGEKESIG